MISASKTTFLRPKVTKNIKNLHTKFCESPPRDFDNVNLIRCFEFRLERFSITTPSATTNTSHFKSGQK